MGSFSHVGEALFTRFSHVKCAHWMQPLDASIGCIHCPLPVNFHFGAMPPIFKSDLFEGLGYLGPWKFPRLVLPRQTAPTSQMDARWSRCVSCARTGAGSTTGPARPPPWAPWRFWRAHCSSRRRGGVVGLGGLGVGGLVGGGAGGGSGPSGWRQNMPQ